MLNLTISIKSNTVSSPVFGRITEDFHVTDNLPVFLPLIRTIVSGLKK